MQLEAPSEAALKPPPAAAASASSGRSFPLGATVLADGVNFSVFSRQANRVQLLLFDDAEAVRPTRVIDLEARMHRTYHYWHVFMAGIGAGQLYGYRASGPFAPERGLRFDPSKSLLDPYGRAVAVPDGYSRQTASQHGESNAIAMKSVVVDPSGYDWDGDVPLRRPIAGTVIYEMHVAGFTRHPSSGVAPQLRGTYAGMIEKIGYLRDLGIAAVELLPIFQFDRQDCPFGLVNYWGYSPVSFFAPHAGYSSRKDLLGPIDEFRDLVKALHRAGIEVILDVVYNHAAEGNAAGPTLCFRGLANEVYYILDTDRAQYADYSGTGNTLNANNAIVRRLISFRSRSRRNGSAAPNSPAYLGYPDGSVLAGTKLIAEAWDAAGLYQVGSFIGDSWRECGPYRDDVRRFVKGDRGTVRPLAQRLIGSPDIYGYRGREPGQSINFVTCHDGFTLNDLVSYNGKHNEANGEANQDGRDENLSWNCGIEGPSDNPEIESLRRRQVKNFLVILLMSVGLPMPQMGDEMRRTQCGNNNAYCQDNNMSWLDWSLLDRHRDLHRFVRTLIGYRRRMMGASSEEALELSLNELLRHAQFDWHGVRLNKPDWADHSHSIALTIRSTPLHLPVWLHVMINAYWEALDFDLPPLPAATLAGWWRWIDTARESPEDIMDAVAAPLVHGTQYRVAPRSVAVLFARNADASALEESVSATHTRAANQTDTSIAQPR